MASPEAEEGSPSGSLAISLALEHLNLVYNVSLQGFKGEWREIWSSVKATKCVRQ